MAVPRFFALIVGVLTAAYFGIGLARGDLNPVGAGIMLLAALLLFLASARKGATPRWRWTIAWLWVAFTVLCVFALGAMLALEGGMREKAMALLLFCTGCGFSARSLWQAGRRKRHRWDGYFDK